MIWCCTADVSSRRTQKCVLVDCSERVEGACGRMPHSVISDARRTVGTTPACRGDRHPADITPGTAHCESAPIHT